MEAIVKDRPSAHLGHIAEGIAIAASPEIAPQIIIGGFDGPTQGNVGGYLPVHEVYGIFLTYPGMGIPAVEVLVVPAIAIGLQGIQQSISGQGMAGFECRGIDGIFRTEWIRVVIEKILYLLFPFITQEAGILRVAFFFQVGDEVDQEQLVIASPFIGLVPGQYLIRIFEEGPGRLFCADEISLSV